MKYRREIDGLRAIAVLPVILFHAGVSLFSGGYVGVDVFFVISGYLITTILLEDIENNRFSIIKFYERRAKRILPALFVVLIACIPFAWGWLIPSQLEDFGKALVAIVFFGSNILFWRQADYFAPTAEENPLLHTWSLAVEEQFYIFFPLLLIGLWRFGRNPVLGTVIALSLVSLALAEWGWRYSPTANFYLLPTRAWELGVGAICAFWLQGGKRPNNNLLAWVGLICVISSITLFDSRTPFPSLYTLLPVGGTALIILFAGSQTYVAKLLSLSPFVGIGLISYSAYLWHQPLLAFARIRSLEEPSLLAMLGLGGLSLVLAYFSWRWVEQPFRSKSFMFAKSRKRVFLFAAVGSLIFLISGSALNFTNGLPKRTAPSGLTFEELNADQLLAHNIGLSPKCEEAFTLAKECRTGDSPSVVVWGDSYAMHLVPAILNSKSLNGRDIIQHTKSNCSPVLGLALTDHHYGPAWAKECIEFNENVYRWLETADSVEYVVLSSPMHIIEKDTVDSNGQVFLNSQTPQQLLIHLNETSQRIAALGKKVVLVSPPPRNGHNLAKCITHQIIFEQDRISGCRFSEEEFMPQHKKVLAFLNSRELDIKVFDLSRLLCSQGECQAQVDGVNIYRDRGHLSIEGSKLMGTKYDLFGLLN